ncbi:transcription repressor NadR [Olsenella profusa]|uniref:Transcription repressor NadR n=1 Tax=Olsenella profusa TaxID=138595 RepID=A0ABS2F286_9ACTN|nr:transcription repressor NadR [Olsenella profusa]MBM6775101.1 transcription repressor NadR [Olsenella profusa]
MTSGDARRAQIIQELRKASGPVSGALLAERCGVSRQVVVTDVALLRSRGEKIVSTNRGYVLESPAPARPVRLFKCRHDVSETADELTCIVDLGGCVEDVFVNHRVYGKLSTHLGVGSRRDVERFMGELSSGVSAPLMQVTDGYHFHHVSAPTEDALDEIAAALDERGYLAEPTAYELAAFA